MSERMNGRSVRHVRTLIRFTAGYFWPCVVFAAILFCAVPLALGLATRAFFDTLSWTALALIVAVQLIEVLAELAVSRAWSGFSYKTHTLLQRNLFAGILRGYGRHGLPPPGVTPPTKHAWRGFSSSAGGRGPAGRCSCRSSPG